MTHRKGRGAAIAAAALCFASLIGVTHSTHAAAAPPSCSYLYFDDTLDGPDNSNGLGSGQKPNLDIFEGDFGLSPDGQTLRAVLTLQSQDFAFSTTETGIDYQMVFTFGSGPNGPNMWATDASLTKNPSGPPTQLFTFDIFQGVSTSQTGLLFTQVVFLANVTGSFSTNPPTVEVDVPLSDITVGGSAPPHVGDVFTGTQGYTASGQGNQGGGNEFISDADPSTTTFGNNYTVGQATCIGPAFVQQEPPTVPESPLMPLLVGAGAAAALGSWFVWRRRRGISARS